MIEKNKAYGKDLVIPKLKNKSNTKKSVSFSQIPTDLQANDESQSRKVLENQLKISMGQEND